MSAIAEPQIPATSSPITEAIISLWDVGQSTGQLFIVTPEDDCSDILPSREVEQEVLDLRDAPPTSS